MSLGEINAKVYIFQNQIKECLRKIQNLNEKAMCSPKEYMPIDNLCWNMRDGINYLLMETLQCNHKIYLIMKNMPLKFWKKIEMKKIALY